MGANVLGSAGTACALVEMTSSPRHVWAAQRDLAVRPELEVCLLQLYAIINRLVVVCHRLSHSSMFSSLSPYVAARVVSQ